jgi:hypothetical protein
MATEDHVSLVDLAAETGVARTTLYTHIARGHLKAYKLGNYTVVTRAAAAAFKKKLKKVSFGKRTFTVYQE